MSSTRRLSLGVLLAGIGMLMPAILGASKTADKKEQVPKLTVQASPTISFSPSRILVRANLVGGSDDYEQYYCPTVEWKWGDGTTSEASADCDPYQSGKSEIRAPLLRPARLPRAGALPHLLHPEAEREADRHGQFGSRRAARSGRRPGRTDRLDSGFSAGRTPRPCRHPHRPLPSRSGLAAPFRSSWDAGCPAAAAGKPRPGVSRKPAAVTRKLSLPAVRQPPASPRRSPRHRPG